MSYSKTIIEGRLTRDPERKATRDGKTFCAFTVAVNRDGKDAPADFFDVICWDRQAENAARYLKKGSRVLVDGRMQSRTKESRNGGKMTTWGLSAERVTYLSERSQSGSSGNDGYISTGQTVRMPRDQFDDMTPADDDDLPF